MLLLSEPPSLQRQRICVRGQVQGVGFRPFVFRQATALGLTGSVHNSVDGVVIEVEGDTAAIAKLACVICKDPPANANVIAIEIETIAPRGDCKFTVQTSDTNDSTGGAIPVDVAVCENCLAELFDPSNRRYRYPFTHCAQCGPRYTIIDAMPYDRVRTAMNNFPLCPACKAEYEDPNDRRFHAEANACPDCGPRLALWNARGEVQASNDEALLEAANIIRHGGIVAVKGIGGFHLLVDAGNEDAVRQLRIRKHREAKPFAVMFPDLDSIRQCCDVGEGEAKLLCEPARPIVLLHRVNGGTIAPAVAPDNRRLGAMLPYAPVHHLLLAELQCPVVATSGNLSDEPIVIDEVEALSRLHNVADFFLVHNRPIRRPVDDSVVQWVFNAPQVLRRGRGYAPTSIAVNGIKEGIVGVGAYLKSTVAFTCNNALASSQHIGDLDSALTRQMHRRTLTDLLWLQHLSAKLCARDLHPDYVSANALPIADLPTIAVQHHVAHGAACLLEHNLAPPALAVVWDGTGYGDDGTIWGGEFLSLQRTNWKRVARLRPFPLPGGDIAIKEPRRAALGLLYAAFGSEAFGKQELPPLGNFSATDLKALEKMLQRNINAPLASSMGRLFDAIAALCGLHQRTDYEGQAAMALEGFAHDATDEHCYDFTLLEDGNGLQLDWQPALEALLADLDHDISLPTIASALHRGLASAIVAVAKHAGENRVVLSGGCFQNVYLTELTVSALRAAGFEALWHQQLPPNDGGIAAGQVAWAAWCEQTDKQLINAIKSNR